MANDRDPSADAMAAAMRQIGNTLFDAGPPLPMPMPDFSSIDRARRESFGYAETLFKPLMKEIEEFQANLSADEEVGAYLAAFGREVLIHVERVAYRNPHLMIFRGTKDGTSLRVELLQHTSQMSVLLVAVPKAGPVARRIGFTSE
jgi:hypothetical protein